MSRESKATISIITIAVAFGLAAAGLMPVLGMISEKYTDVSTSMVQLMQTLPNAFVILSSLLIGFLTTRFTKKKITIVALVIICVCGLLPFFFEGFTVLFISRLLIGLGFGIIGPINTAIISEFFPPEKRAVYMGLNVGAMGACAIIANLIGGILAKAGLRYFFLIYLIAFICLVIVQIFLPETPAAVTKKVSDFKLTKMVYSLCAMSFIYTLFISAYAMNISMHIAETITQDTGASGIATAVNATVVSVTGMAFGIISSKLRKATLPFSVFTAAAGFFSAVFIPGMAGAIIASFLCGLAVGCFNAMSSFLVSISVETDAAATASGVLSIVGNIGGLIAPLVLSSLAVLLGGNTPKNQFTAAMGGMLVFGIMLSFSIGRSKVDY